MGIALESVHAQLFSHVNLSRAGAANARRKMLHWRVDLCDRPPEVGALTMVQPAANSAAARRAARTAAFASKLADGGASKTQKAERLRQQTIQELEEVQA